MIMHFEVEAPAGEDDDVHVQIAELLLQRGADPEEEGISGQTALHVAALYGNLPMIDLLLRCGVFGLFLRRLILSNAQL